MALIRRIWSSVLDMEELLTSDKLPGPRLKVLKECMNDLAWRHGQVALEILTQCEADRWDAESEEIRVQSYLLFAGCPNTKFYLEDSFSHMADVASRFARHCKMTKSLGDVFPVPPAAHCSSTLPYQT